MRISPQSSRSGDLDHRHGEPIEGKVGNPPEDTKMDYAIWALLIIFSGVVVFNMWEDFIGSNL
jgi:hypothetical protein